MATYRTSDGDVLDRIAFDQLGSEAHVTAILETNPNLAKRPAVLPAGVEIELPKIAPVAARPTIRLWGEA